MLVVRIGTWGSELVKGCEAGTILTTLTKSDLVAKLGCYQCKNKCNNNWFAICPPQTSPKKRLEKNHHFKLLEVMFKKPEKGTLANPTREAWCKKPSHTPSRHVVEPVDAAGHDVSSTAQSAQWAPTTHATRTIGAVVHVQKPRPTLHNCNHLFHGLESQGWSPSNLHGKDWISPQIQWSTAGFLELHGGLEVVFKGPYSHKLTNRTYLQIPTGTGTTKTIKIKFRPVSNVKACP